MKGDTPIRRQYLKIKEKHKDAILLFRLGDFYEAFDEDAKLVARELDIALTSKPMGKNMRVPLAGIPYFVLEKHLATLIARGHRVAICEQTSVLPVKNEDGKKLIQREVTRVVTAGTIVEPQLLDSRSNNFLVAIFSDGQKTGIAYADVSTGDFAATEIDNRYALAELDRLKPAEIVIAETQETFSNRELPHYVTRLDTQFFDKEIASKTLYKHFSTTTLKPFGLENLPLATSAAGALIHYLKTSRFDTAEQLNRLTSYDSSDFMFLDGRTYKSLEIFESESGASLISVIERTKTAMGSRILRRWLRQPLLDTTEIFKRQQHLEWFKINSNSREAFREILEEIKDLERLSSRAKTNLINAQEIRVLGKSLELIPSLKKILRTDTVKFGQILVHLPECERAANLIDSAISDELPTRFNDQTGIIRDGYSEELDNLRNKVREGKNFLKDLERRERQRTGIKSLRVGFNKVFGYYIEVSKPNTHLVPKDYQRKQTLIPSERYITLELKEHESFVIHAQERIAELESSLFRRVCTEVGKSRNEILLSSSTIAYLDVIAGLADVADDYNFTCPTVNDTSLLRIKNSRHPVIEQILSNAGKNFYFK